MHAAWLAGSVDAVCVEGVCVCECAHSNGAWRERIALQLTSEE